MVLALASTTLVNLAYVREHEAVGSLPALSLRRPLESLRALLASRAWLAGFAMESAGFALYVAALALAPLALVQSVAAGGVGVLAFASARVARRRVSRREALGAAVAVSGLVFLSLSLINGDYNGAPGDIVPSAVWLGATGAAALVVLAARRRLGAALGSGLAGGLLFSCGDIATKLVTQGGVRFAFIPAAIAGYVLGTSLLQVGYQSGSALTIAGIATLLTNALPIAAGPVLFDETLPHGALGALRIIAFATVVAGAALLARPPAGAEQPAGEAEQAAGEAAGRSG